MEGHDRLRLQQTRQLKKKKKEMCCEVLVLQWRSSYVTSQCRSDWCRYQNSLNGQGTGMETHGYA